MLDLGAAPLTLAPRPPSIARINGAVKLHSRLSPFAKEIKLNVNVGRRRQQHYYSSSSSSVLKAVSKDAEALTQQQQQQEVQPSHIQANDSPYPPVRGANLGGWLLIERWMSPELFKDVKNDDLLDGTQVTFKSIKENKSLVAKEGDGAPIIAKEINPMDWTNKDRDTFALWRVTDTTFQFRVCEKIAMDNPDLPPVMPGILADSKFIGLDNKGQGGLVVDTATPGDNETFEIIRNPVKLDQVHIRSLKNGHFIQVKPDSSVLADVSPEDASWQDDDSSVFLMSTGRRKLEGEFQLINGLGKEKAEKILKEHWNSFIVEEDFEFMGKHNINAVRIPVGYWIAKEDPSFPFIAGSLTALDRAFDWGLKHGVRIIIDLHAVPGAANADSHGGSRDGCLCWGLTNETIEESVEVVSFLTKRYAEKKNFLAIELINEPLAPQIEIDRLKKYYKSAYEAIRSISPSIYVIISSRFMAHPDEFLEFASDPSRSRVVLDIHNYQIIFQSFTNKTAQEIIDYVRNNRAKEMQPINPPNGLPLLYVGEWTGRWDVKNASEKDFQEYLETQLQVYGTATFGWTYWTYKCSDQSRSNIDYKKGQWSMKWLIENGYI